MPRARSATGRASGAERRRASCGDRSARAPAWPGAAVDVATCGGPLAEHDHRLSAEGDGLAARAPDHDRLARVAVASGDEIAVDPPALEGQVGHVVAEDLEGPGERAPRRRLI